MLDAGGWRRVIHPTLSCAATLPHPHQNKAQLTPAPTHKEYESDRRRRRLPDGPSHKAIPPLQIDQATSRYCSPYKETRQYN